MFNKTMMLQQVYIQLKPQTMSSSKIAQYVFPKNSLDIINIIC